MAFARHHFFITTQGFTETEWMLCVRYGKNYVKLVSSKSRYRLSKIRQELQALWQLEKKEGKEMAITQCKK